MRTVLCTQYGALLVVASSRSRVLLGTFCERTVLTYPGDGGVHFLCVEGQLEHRALFVGPRCAPLPVCGHAHVQQHQAVRLTRLHHGRLLSDIGRRGFGGSPSEHLFDDGVATWAACPGRGQRLRTCLRRTRWLYVWDDVTDVRRMVLCGRFGDARVRLAS